MSIKFDIVNNEGSQLIQYGKSTTYLIELGVSPEVYVGKKCIVLAKPWSK
jgi:hypothetical protein